MPKLRGVRFYLGFIEGKYLRIIDGVSSKLCVGFIRKFIEEPSSRIAFRSSLFLKKSLFSLVSIHFKYCLVSSIN